jgi:tripartite-type tricarboxylate transporter receptor subunit TctC
MPSSTRVLVRLLKIVGMVVSLCVAMQAPAQTLDAPLKLIVPTAPGGAIDRATRILADSLKDRLGVAVIVENQGAAGGLIAAQRVKTAQAGENVLLVGNPTTNVLAPILFKNAGYDPQRDFVPLSCIRTYSYAVAVGPATPVRDMKELVAWLKANPTQANFGVRLSVALLHLSSH